jgi:hypothetical protein
MYVESLLFSCFLLIMMFVCGGSSILVGVVIL